jgi:hypothetical protein
VSRALERSHMILKQSGVALKNIDPVRYSVVYLDWSKFSFRLAIYIESTRKRTYNGVLGFLILFEDNLEKLPF